MSKYSFMQGNIAMTEGAIVAGARFYAGYPITPSSEVAESASIRLPEVNGIFVQMEDEIGSMAALIGASCAGAKSFTATSGPGISLMSENLGLAIMAEVPCVVINVQRSGPSTGLATKPAQGDVMQARWGTHGDHPMIALCPSTVQDCFDLTIEAFNYAEIYRTPVFLLADEIVGHLKEQVIIKSPEEVNIIDRIKPTCSPDKYKPYEHKEGITPLASYGSEYVFKINGSMHDAMGRPCSGIENAQRIIKHLNDKVCYKDISLVRRYNLDDAESVIIAYGGTTRAALSAMKIMRKNNKKVGVLQIISIWPVPEGEIREVLLKSKLIIVPELNLGQYIHEIRKLNSYKNKIIGVNKIDSSPITPTEIVSAIEEVSDNV